MGSLLAVVAVRMSLFTDGQVKRMCPICGERFRPKVPEQIVCSAWCRRKRNRLQAKSARRIWDAGGRKLMNDDTDLRTGENRSPRYARKSERRNENAETPPLPKMQGLGP